jgi:hypothetical protein
MRPAFAVVLACLPSVSLSAQWRPFVRPDVPRTADGKPDLNAPPPRLANGKPDFSGAWESRVPPSGRPGAALPSIGEAPPVATFFNVAANMKEGLPFTPWAAEVRKQRMATNSRDNPDANCLPIGFMERSEHHQGNRDPSTRSNREIWRGGFVSVRQTPC